MPSSPAPSRHPYQHAGALGALREADEMRELALLEKTLREDSLTMERDKQKLAAQLKDYRKEELQKLSEDAEKDLQVFNACTMYIV